MIQFQQNIKSSWPQNQYQKSKQKVVEEFMVLLCPSAI